MESKSKAAARLVKTIDAVRRKKKKPKEKKVPIRFLPSGHPPYVEHRDPEVFRRDGNI